MMKGLTALGVDMELAEKAKKRNFILALAFTIGLIAGIPCIVVGATNMGDNKGFVALRQQGLRRPARLRHRRHRARLLRLPADVDAPRHRQSGTDRGARRHAGTPLHRRRPRAAPLRQRQDRLRHPPRTAPSAPRSTPSSAPTAAQRWNSPKATPPAAPTAAASSPTPASTDAHHTLNLHKPPLQHTKRAVQPRVYG